MASLIKKAVLACVALLEDAVERLGDPNGSEVMLEALRKARDRGAELALENARLEDEVERLTRSLDELQDKYAFNGPTLYRDEVAALKCSVAYLNEYRREAPSTPQYVSAIERLLTRSDHCPITADDLQKQVNDIITGHTPAVPWTDGSATFDAELLPVDEPCTCNELFRTAEDWRDHMPCNGSRGK